MAAPVFDVREHVVEAQHIREYPRATAHSQDEVLRLSVKQYTPVENRGRDPQPGDVTIIGAHANGFPKELYEAMWEDLHRASKAHNFHIRGIWIADVAWEGRSGVLNEDALGNDPSWYDHSRDLLHVINHFRREMPRPLVGVGHSFGGNILVNLALFHPRLFSALVLLDPVIDAQPARPPRPARDSPVVQSTFRRDVWPSREAAAAAFARSKFFQAWDPRVFAAWVAHGVRDLPTRLHPDGGGAGGGAGGVTLTTTKHQEVFTFQRPLYQVDPRTGAVGVDRRALPDLDPAVPAELDPAMAAAYRPEPPLTFARLPHLRPGALYVFGGTSNISPPEGRAAKLAATGAGAGGSGGAAAGRVRGVVLERAGHLVAMEDPGACAAHAAAWVGGELARWRREEEAFAAWARRPPAEKQTVDAAWMDLVALEASYGRGRPKPRI